MTGTVVLTYCIESRSPVLNEAECAVSEAVVAPDASAAVKVVGEPFLTSVHVLVLLGATREEIIKFLTVIGSLIKIDCAFADGVLVPSVIK